MAPRAIPSALATAPASSPSDETSAARFGGCSRRGPRVPSKRAVPPLLRARDGGACNHSVRVLRPSGRLLRRQPRWKLPGRHGRHGRDPSWWPLVMVVRAPHPLAGAATRHPTASVATGAAGPASALTGLGAALPCRRGLTLQGVRKELWGVYSLRGRGAASERQRLPCCRSSAAASSRRASSSRCTVPPRTTTRPRAPPASTASPVASTPRLGDPSGCRYQA